MKSAVRRIEGHLPVTPSPACGSSITGAHYQNFQCYILTLQQGAYKKTKNANKTNKKKKEKKVLETCLARVNVTQFGSRGTVGSVWHLTTPATQKGEMEGCLTVNRGDRTETQVRGRRQMGSRQAGRLDGWMDGGIGWLDVSLSKGANVKS